MNLHAVVSPIIGAINPNELVSVASSIGNTTAADGTPQLAYATPGSLTASIGGTFTASIPDPVNAPTTLSVSAVLTGSLQVTDLVAGTDGINSLSAGTFIVSQLSGTPGGIGTYQLSIGAILNPCTVTSTSTVLNVSAVALGLLQAGQTLADLTAALQTGTLITGRLSGAQGGPGLYSISQPQTVASEAMTTSLSLYGQIQPLSGGDLRHVDAINLQGSHRTLYYNGLIRPGVRVAIVGGDIVTRIKDGSVWKVTQSSEPWHSTAGFSRVLITLQDGS